MKKLFIISILSLVSSLVFTDSAYSQDSTRRPARELIDSTSEKTDRITGRNQKKIVLEKAVIQSKDSSCQKRKGKHAKNTKPRTH